MVEQKIKHSFPDDWNLEPFYLITSMNGRIGWQGLKQSEFTQNPDDPFLITGMNFKDGKIRWDEVYHIPKKRYDEAKNIQLKKDDVLITKDGTIGKVLFVDNIPYPHKASLNSHLLVFRPLRKKYKPKFLFYQLQSKPFLEHIEENKSGTTFFGITEKSIGKYNVFLPPIPEQEAISESLSDIETLIDSLESLIQKKKNIKQGAMQELLTGKRRLEGFSGEWETVEIGNYIDLLTGFPFPSEKYSHDGIKLLRGSNIKRGNIDWSEEITEYWNEITPKLKKYFLNEGDIAVAMDGSLVGKSFSRLTKNDLPALLLQRVARIRSTSINMDYLKEWICSELFTKYCDSVKTVSAIPHISPNDIRKFSIMLPNSEEEQSKIAKILFHMSNEIQELEKQLEKYTNLKQAMMQKLLTGEIRLV